MLQPLDLKLLVLIMEFLTAQKEDLDSADKRKKWCDRVRTFSPVVQQLLDSVSLDKYTDRLNGCRYLLCFVLQGALHYWFCPSFCHIVCSSGCLLNACSLGMDSRTKFIFGTVGEPTIRFFLLNWSFWYRASVFIWLVWIVLCKFEQVSVMLTKLQKIQVKCHLGVNCALKKRMISYSVVSAGSCLLELCVCGYYLQLMLYSWWGERIARIAFDVFVFTRCMWNRIIAIHLFIQHVCPPGTKDQLTVKKLMPLWNVSMMLLDHVNSLQVSENHQLNSQYCVTVKHAGKIPNGCMKYRMSIMTMSTAGPYVLQGRA